MANKDVPELDMEQFVSEHSSIVGKTETIYCFVSHQMSVENFKEYCRDKSQNALKIKDSHRRGRARSAYYAVQSFLDDYQDDDILDVLLALDVDSDSLEAYRLSEDHIRLLKSYDCGDLNVWCGDHYPIDQISDYLESDEHFNLFRVKNNSVTHIKLGRTKKVRSDAHESRSLVLADYVAGRLAPNQKYIAYGTSSKLAPLMSSEIASRAYSIMNHDVSDADAIDMIGKMDQSDILDDLDSTLELIHNMKTMDRVIFKKDFTLENIAKLEKVYLDQRIEARFRENCDKKGLDVSFEIMIINSNIKDFQEGRELKLMNDYGGVVGLTYY